MAVVVTTRIKAKAGFERQLEQAMRALIAKVREEGSSDSPEYTLYRDASDPACLILCERHAVLPAPESGSGGPSALVGALTALIDGRPILQTFIELEESLTLKQNNLMLETQKYTSSPPPSHVP